MQGLARGQLHLSFERQRRGVMDKRLEDLSLMPRSLRWLLSVIPGIVGAFLIAIGLTTFGDFEPRGTIAWLIAEGVPRDVYGAVALVCGLLLLVFTHRIRLYTLRGAVIYGLLQLPYPFYALASSYYLLFVSATGSRVTVVIHLGGLLFSYIVVAFAAFLGAWLQAVERRRE